jgi:hypothetical protein
MMFHLEVSSQWPNKWLHCITGYLLIYFALEIYSKNEGHISPCKGAPFTTRCSVVARNSKMSPDTSDLDLETRPAVTLNQGETYKEQPETADGEPFGDEEGAEVRYRTLEWWFVSPVQQKADEVRLT